jgi:hypothetical protein
LLAVDPSHSTMFFRVKPAGAYRYLQIAHSVRDGKKVRQQGKSHPGAARFTATERSVGTADALRPAPLSGLCRPGLPCGRGELEPVSVRRWGPDLVFGRLWQESGIAEGLRSLLKGRRYEFDVERAI